ncbi:MAG: c-type cytochrome [Bryobacteraceae bacterium]|nr:c-type cytochrome [Bryobacteraceae bacterium]
MKRVAAIVFAALLPAAEHKVPLGLDAYVPAPETNPLSPETAALGRALFFDPALSRDGAISCAGCHDPARAFTDDKPLAVGVEGRKGTRRAPALLNRAYGRAFFWDGRALTLEDQVLKPIENPVEMDLPLEEALRRLKASGKYPPLDEALLAAALSTYVRTILAGDSPYDRYVAGDRSALDAEQLAGLRLFRGKAGCGACHLGPNLTDERFHNTGAGWKDGTFPDLGRFAVTGREEDRGAFKTPTLREAARRAPYMHDGSLATLEDVIEHYDKGGAANPALDPEMRPLHLTAEEKRALAAFLRALTGEIREGL